MAQSSSLHAWHVAMVRPNRERHVVDELRKLDPPFAAVCPRQKIREPVKVGVSVRNGHMRWRGKIEVREVERVLFPNYVIFSGPGWHRARKVDGLTLVVRLPGNWDEAGTLPPIAAARLLGPAGDGLVVDVRAVVEALKGFAEGDRVKVGGIRDEPVDATVIATTYRRVMLLIGSVKMNVPIEVVSAA